MRFNTNVHRESSPSQHSLFRKPFLLSWSLSRSPSLSRPRRFPEPRYRSSGMSSIFEATFRSTKCSRPSVLDQKAREPPRRSQSSDQVQRLKHANKSICAHIEDRQIRPSIFSELALLVHKQQRLTSHRWGNGPQARYLPCG